MRTILLFPLFVACTAPKSDDTAGVDTGTPDAGPSFDVLAEPSNVTDVTPGHDGAGLYYLADRGDTLCFVEPGGTPTCGDGGFVAGTGLDVTTDGAQIGMVAKFPDEEPAAAAAIVAAAAFGAICRVSGLCGPGTLTGVMEPLLETVPYAPVALDVATMGGAEYGVFSGLHEETHGAGVFRVPVGGGAVEVLASGMAAVPTGVAVANDGAVYAAATVDGDGVLYEIRDGVATPIATGILLGTPAGIALTPDDGAVMVSSLLDGGSAVTIVGRADHAVSHVTEPISVNTGSGGLHRAAAEPTVYGWAGVSAGTSGDGRVYRIGF